MSKTFLVEKLSGNPLGKILGFSAIALLILLGGIKIKSKIDIANIQSCIENKTQNSEELPFELTDTLLWLKASEGVELDDNGGVVKWLDLTCKNNHATQSKPELRPQLITQGSFGNPAIKFDGSQNLNGKLGKFYAPVTIFVTLKYAEHDEPEYILSIGNGSVKNANLRKGNHISISRENGSYYAMWGYPKELESSHLRASDAALPALTNLNITVRYRGVDRPQNHILWVNGKKYQPKGESTATLKQLDGQYYLPEQEIFQNKGDYAVGRWLHKRYPWYLKAEVDEILILDQEYSEAERARIEQYIRNK